MPLSLLSFLSPTGSVSWSDLDTPLCRAGSSSPAPPLWLACALVFSAPGALSLGLVHLVPTVFSTLTSSSLPGALSLRGQQPFVAQRTSFQKSFFYVATPPWNQCMSRLLPTHAWLSMSSTSPVIAPSLYTLIKTDSSLGSLDAHVKNGIVLTSARTLSIHPVIQLVKLRQATM